MAAVEIDSTIHLSDIHLPEGVSIIALTHGEDHDLPIAAVHAPKGAAQDDEDADETEAASEEPAADE